MEMLKSSRTSVVDADRQGRPSTSTDEQNIKRAKAKILENCRITTAEIPGILEIGHTFPRPWCKLLM
jgi:hypothetical protein